MNYLDNVNEPTRLVGFRGMRITLLVSFTIFGAAVAYYCVLYLITH